MPSSAQPGNVDASVPLVCRRLKGSAQPSQYLSVVILNERRFCASEWTWASPRAQSRNAIAIKRDEHPYWKLCGWSCVATGASPANIEAHTPVRLEICTVHVGADA